MGIFRSIKKSRRASSDIDEKIEYLNKELEKTGLHEMMTTPNMYQQGTKVPNQNFIDFQSLSFNGYSLGLSAPDGNHVGGAVLGIDPSTGLSGVALSPPDPITGDRLRATTVINGLGDTITLRPGQKYQRGSGNNAKIITMGSAVWFYNSVSGTWSNLEFFTEPGQDGVLGYWDTVKQGQLTGLWFLNTTGPHPSGNILSLLSGLNFGPGGVVGPPQTTVLTQNRLDDPGFLPINIPISIQAFFSLLNKIRKNLADRPKKYYDMIQQRDQNYYKGSLTPKDSAFQKIKNFVQDILPPSLEWATELAISLIANKPVIRTENDVSRRDVKQLLDNITTSQFTLSNQEEVVADGNVFLNKKTGRIESNHINSNLPDGSGEGQLQHSSNLKHKDLSGDIGKKNPKIFGIPIFLGGYTDAVANEGSGTVQVVTPDDGSQGYVLISNFSYFNMNNEKGEDNTGLGSFIHNLLGKDKNKPNTGDLEGIPNHIKTMKFTNVRVSLDDDIIPDSFTEKIKLKQRVKKHFNENYIGESKKISLSEAVKLGHFEPEQLNVNIEDLRKGIMPEFPKDPPPEMIGGYAANSRLAPKKIEGEPFIKITKKDLAKNHKLKDSEIKEFMDQINAINEFIKKHPEELIYAQTRYPKHDPRLAQLNWEMDQKLEASKEYMDKHYPENQKLFTKIQKSIKKNIELTDPKSFKGVKAPKYKGVDLTDYKRRRAVVSKHYKKAVKIRKLFSKNRWLQTESFTNITTGNKVGQTFRHNPSGQTVSTAGALGGVESVPSTVSVFGDNIPGPNASSYALQGYAKPLGNVLKRKETEDTNKKLDASQEFVRKVGADEIMDARVNQRGTAKISDKQKRINKAAETLIRYFANKLPEGEWNDYLGNEYVKHAFKVGQLLPNGGISVGDNVIGSAGGFTQLSPTSDPNKRVYRMSFKGLGVDTNIEQFSKAEYNIFRKAAYNMLGKYSADLTPSIGGDILSKALSVAIGAGASKVLELVKAFGGAKDVNAHIDISVEELEMLNPELIRKWHVPHNLDYGKYGKPSKASNIDRVTRYFKVNGYLPPFARPKGTVPYNYGDHPEYDPAAIKRLMKKNNRNVVKDTSLEPSKAVKTIKKMAKTKSIGFDRNEPIVRRKKKKT